MENVVHLVVPHQFQKKRKETLCLPNYLSSVENVVLQNVPEDFYNFDSTNTELWLLSEVDFELVNAFADELLE